MNIRTAIATTALALSLTSCDGILDPIAEGCEDQQNDAIAKLGYPEDVYTYEYEHDAVQELWWWSQGTSRTYSWGRTYGDCEVSTFNFKPIY